MENYLFQGHLLVLASLCLGLVLADGLKLYIYILEENKGEPYSKLSKIWLKHFTIIIQFTLVYVFSHAVFVMCCKYAMLYTEKDRNPIQNSSFLEVKRLL